MGGHPHERRGGEGSEKPLLKHTEIKENPVPRCFETPLQAFESPKLGNLIDFQGGERRAQVVQVTVPAIHLEMNTDVVKCRLFQLGLPRFV